MRQPKDGHYTVYLLPAEWYVGYTSDVKTRMRLHANQSKRDISNWVVLAEVDNKRDALDIEAHYHNRGYNGKVVSGSNTKEFQVRRAANINYTARSSNTDYNARNNNINHSARTLKYKKPIIQLTIDGKFIREWPSTTDAANELKTDPTSISNCLRGKCQTSGGYKWEYKV